jgi:hypothetical protein
VFPFNARVKLFGDALLEAYLGNLKGLIADWATPGFDAGISFLFWRWDDGGGLGFEVKYRGTWYENHYIHAIGIGFVGSIGRELSPW